MINKFILLISCLQFTLAFSQVGIGTNTPHSSAVLELESTQKGFLPPRITKANRDNILNPPEGLLIFNSTVNCLEVFTGPDTKWFSLCPNTAPFATNLMISGEFSPDYDLTASYDYNDNESNPEDGTVIKWYLADNLTAPKTEIVSAQNNLTYTVQASDVGKYIFFSVIPKDNLGLEGSEVFSLGGEVVLSSVTCAPNVSAIIVSAGQGFIRIRCSDNILENRSWNGNTVSSSYSYKTSASTSPINISSWDNTSRSLKTITPSEMADLSEFSGANTGTYNTPNCHSGQINGHPITISGNGYIRIHPTTKVMECYYKYTGTFCNGAGGQFTTTHTSTTCNVSN